MLSISIVIYSLDSIVLSKTLESIIKSIRQLPEKWEVKKIVIVDNGHNKAGILSVTDQFADDSVEFKVISTYSNMGYGRAHNIAINQSRAKYHLVLNPDVIISPSSLYNGLEFLEKNPNAVALTPSAVDAANNIQYIAKSYPSVMTLLLRAIDIKVLNTLFEKQLANYEIREIINANRCAEVTIISGCFMLCRNKTLQEVGGFDERYFLYFEDFALSLELQKKGRLYYLPTMKIVHFGGNSSRKGLLHISFFLSSMIKFFNKFGWTKYQ